MPGGFFNPLRSLTVMNFPKFNGSRLPERSRTAPKKLSANPLSDIALHASRRSGADASDWLAASCALKPICDQHKITA